MTIIEKILLELCAKDVVEDGMPDFTNEKHLLALNEVLVELNWPMEARGELLYTLMEADKTTFVGITKDKKRRYFKDKEALDKAVEAGSVTLPDDKEKEKEKEKEKGGSLSGSDFERGGDKKEDEPEDSPDWTRTAKKSKRAKKYQKDDGGGNQEDAIKGKKEYIKNLLRLQKEDPEAYRKELKKVTTSDRIGNLEAKAEFDLDGKEEQRVIKKLDNLRSTLEKNLETADDQQQVVILTTLAYLYEGRENAGAGKNMLGHTDIDLLNKNRERLFEMYDDAKPKLVENGVRKVRDRKVSEETVRASYNALPDVVKNALKGKGKVGKDGENLHFLGYIKNDGTLTSDVNDPDIKKDENGKPMVKRGKVPSNDRGILIWRMYLEQGGRDAYTGEPLDLESMDLEHVVGFQNSDKGQPTEEDYKNREHEANHVLCSSRANQNKKDKNMKQFFEDDVDKHMDGDKPKPEEYFRNKKEGFDKINERTTLEEQISLGLQGNPKYKLKGGGVTEDINDPNVEISELGTPEVASSTFDESVTLESLEESIKLCEDEISDIQETLLSQPDISKEDRDAIKGVKSRIGQKLLNAMGMTRYLQDPSGRRASKVSGTDDWYKGVALSMADTPVSEREKLREEYQRCIKDASLKEVLAAKNPKMANPVMTALMMKRGVLSEKIIEKYPGAYGLNPSGKETSSKAGWKKAEDGSLIIIYKGKEYSVKDYADIKLKEANDRLGTDIK